MSYLSPSLRHPRGVMHQPTKLAAALTSFFLFSFASAASAADSLKVEENKSGVAFYTTSEPSGDEHQKISGSDHTYSSIDFSDASGYHIENQGSNVTLTGDENGKIVIGSTTAEFEGFGGGSFNIGSENGKRATVTAKSFSTRTTNNGYFTNIDAVLTDSLSSKSAINIKKSTISAKNILADGGSITADNSTITTEQLGIEGGSVVLTNHSVLNNQFKKYQITDSSGKTFEAYSSEMELNGLTPNNSSAYLTRIFHIPLKPLSHEPMIA